MFTPFKSSPAPGKKKIKCEGDVLPLDQPTINSQCGDRTRGLLRALFLIIKF